MKSIPFCFLFLFSFVASLSTVASTIEYVFVIGLDGVSAEGIETADTPRMDALRAAGASTLQMRAVMPTSSLPNWASFLYGAGVEQHGVTGNSWTNGNSELRPTAINANRFFPSILSLIKTQRPELTTGFYTDWVPNQVLIEPGTVDVLFFPETPKDTSANRIVRSGEVMDRVISGLRAQEANFVFAHLDAPDHFGHKHEWESPEYIASVEAMDGMVGDLVDAISGEGLSDRSLLIIVSDHGGLGTGHGGATTGEVEVPWMIAGPGIRQGLDLGPFLSVYDTAATVAHAFGLRIPSSWTGRPVKGAFQAEPLPAVAASSGGPSALDQFAEGAFSVTATDPLGRDVEVQIDWGDGLRPIWTRPDASGTTFALHKSYLSAGTYAPRARTVAAGGTVGDWVALGSVEVAAAAGVWKDLTGLWEFMDADHLGRATVGEDLLVEGVAPTHFSTKADARPEARELEGVIQTTGGVGNHLRAEHGIGANGGGAMTNEFSFVFDVLAEGSIEWHTFYQSDLSNRADAKFFARATPSGASPPGSIGRGGLGYSDEALPLNRWHRVVLTFDFRPGGSVRSYVDGVLFHQYDNPGVDSFWSLDPAEVLFFADQDGENQPWFVAALATFGRALNPEEVAALGTPETRISLGWAVASDYREWLQVAEAVRDGHPLADPDGDGKANLLEYVFNSKPARFDGSQMWISGSGESNTLTFSFPRRVRSPEITEQALQVSEDLIAWDSLAIPESSEGAFRIIPSEENPLMEWVLYSLDDKTEPRLFFRLSVQTKTQS